jgi:hypothetical protein
VGCSDNSRGHCQYNDFDASFAALYTEDSGTDMSLNKNNHTDAYCAEGYKLVSSTNGTGHASFETGAGIADDNNNNTVDAIYETCEKCPTGQSSAGGTSRSCHTVSNEWATCSHMGCILEGIVSKNCVKHRSANPHADLTAVDVNGTLAPIAIAENTCHGWNTTLMDDIKRIKVFHHGHEQAGTSHKCSLNGTRADSDRLCVCKCKTATFAEQTTQQAAREADNAAYALRSAAQSARSAVTPDSNLANQEWDDASQEWNDDV